MERSRVTLVTLMLFVLFNLQRISGAEVEMRVRRRDNITIYSDCVWKSGYYIAWFRNSSHEHHSKYTVNLMLGARPRYKSVWNPSNHTYDLVVKNITDSDLGLYYCALHERKVTKDETGVVLYEDVYHYGNRTTRLSLLDMSVPCAGHTQTPPTPPVSDCSICWKLLVSVCPVCVLLSSTCVYYICCCKIKAQVKTDQGESDKRQTQKRNEGGGGDVCYASLDLLTRGQKRVNKKRVESSDFRTYSEVKTDQM